MKTYLLLLMLIVAGCATTPLEEKRITTNVVAYEYNDIASQYYSRPTFAELMTQGEKSWLVLERTNYAPDSWTTLHYSNLSVATYLQYIDQYLRMTEGPTGEEPFFDTVLGKAPGFAGQIEFSVYSGNENNHYLVVSNCFIGCNFGDHLYTRESALALRAQLIELRDGTL